MEKKILFIGMNYFSYTKAIVSEFENIGYSVKYYDIENWNYYSRAVNALSQATFRKLRDSWHRSIIHIERQSHYDIIFFLQAHQFSEENIKALRVSHKEAKFIFYTWDSVDGLARRAGDYRKNIKYFDKCFTFDYFDAEKLDINYLPLFCIRRFQKEIKCERKNGVYFIGNLEHVNRYKAVRAFKDYCEVNNIEFKMYMSCRPRMFINLLSNGVIPRHLKASPIRERDFDEMMDWSGAVFDFANHKQSGMTMRVIENICAGKKIITNNRNVAKEEFYTRDRVFIYKDLDFQGVHEFLQTALERPGENYPQFHIQTFVKNLLE